MSFITLLANYLDDGLVLSGEFGHPEYNAVTSSLSLDINEGQSSSSRGWWTNGEHNLDEKKSYFEVRDLLHVPRVAPLWSAKALNLCRSFESAHSPLQNHHDGVEHSQYGKWAPCWKCWWRSTSACWPTTGHSQDPSTDCTQFSVIRSDVDWKLTDSNLPIEGMFVRPVLYCLTAYSCYWPIHNLIERSYGHLNADSAKRRVFRIVQRSNSSRWRVHVQKSEYLIQAWQVHWLELLE